MLTAKARAVDQESGRINKNASDGISSYLRLEIDTLGLEPDALDLEVGAGRGLARMITATKL